MTDWLDTSSATPAYLAAPDNGVQGPGILVLHSFWGLNDFFKSYCNRLAEAGFVAAAPELYKGAIATSVEEAQRMAKNLDFESALVTVIGSVEFLRIHPAVKGEGLGAVGFSMGGAWALMISNVEKDYLRAAVTYYGTTEADFSESRSAYLGHFAPLDPWESDKDIQKLEDTLRAAGREVTFYTYPDTRHWFAEADRPEYNPEAARLAFDRTIKFLKRHLFSDWQGDES